MQNLPERNPIQTNKQRAQRIKIKVQIKKQKLLQSKEAQIQPAKTSNKDHLTQKQKRKMKNRQSAKRSRKKKKRYIQSLDKQIKKFKIVLSSCPICKLNLQAQDQNSIQKDETKQDSVEKIKSNCGRKPNEHDKSQQQISKIKKIRKDVQTKRNRQSAKESRQRVNQRIQALEEQSQRLKEQIQNCEICKYYQMNIQIPQQQDNDSDSSEVAIVLQKQRQQMINPQVNEQNEWQRQRLESQSSISKFFAFSFILLVAMAAIYHRDPTIKSNQDGRLLITSSTNRSQFKNQSYYPSKNLANGNSVSLTQVNTASSQAYTTLSIEPEKIDYCQKSQIQHQEFLNSLEQQRKALDKQSKRYCSQEYPQLCALNQFKRIRLLRYEYWSRDLAKKKCQSVTGRLSQVDKLYFASILQDIQVQMDRNFKSFMNSLPSTTGILDYAYNNHLHGILKTKMYKNQLSQSIKTSNTPPFVKNYSKNVMNVAFYAQL